MFTYEIEGETIMTPSFSNLETQLLDRFEVMGQETIQADIDFYEVVYLVRNKNAANPHGFVYGVIAIDQQAVEHNIAFDKSVYIALADMADYINHNRYVPVCSECGSRAA
jgi:hypothetical protein